MLIELSTLTFTNQNDIVPLSERGQILNTGVANTLAGNDTITGFKSGDSSDPNLQYGIVNFGTLNTGKDNDVITGEGSGTTEYSPSSYGGILIAEGSIFDTEEGDDRISGTGDFYAVAIYGRTTRGIVNRSFSFNTGDGNDTIEGTGFVGISNGGFINTGNGKDIITAKGGYNEYGGSGMVNGSTINTGNDDDIITADGVIENYGTINTGDGKDSIIVTTPESFYANALENFKVIETGDGDDIISSNGYFSRWNFSRAAIYNKGTISTGNGQDFIISTGNFTNRGGVFLGEGDDSITASISNDVDFRDLALENFNAVETGEGDDIISTTGVLYNEGVINTGNGNDYIEGVDINGIGYGIYNKGGSINTGDGNDSIIANGGFESGPNSSGSVFLGEGEDYIKGFGSGDFYGGNGNDTLELTPGTYTVGIWGKGGESPIFTKGNQLMITSEFEKLKAGSTIYDFTSLTAGQIITIA
jgi:hypothetical protein